MVSGFNLGELEQARCGGVGYDPRMLLGVLLFAISDGERSSRRIEKRCRFDARYRLVAGGLDPDHNTIARFRRRLAGELPELFRQALELAKREGLVRNRCVALDGTRIPSSASQWQQALAEAEVADADISDPDARFLMTRRGHVLGYNAQTIVDMETGILLAAKVSNHSNDASDIEAMLEELDANLDSPPKILAADAGYDSGSGAQAFAQRHIVTYIPPKRKPFWVIDEQGRIVCPAGNEPAFRSNIANKRGRHVQLSVEGCDVCPVRCHANKEKTLRHRLGIDPIYVVRQQLRSRTPEAKDMMRRRRTSIERVFGCIKGNGGFRRFLLRGLDGANLEYGLECLVYNLKKVVLPPLRAIWGALRLQGARAVPLLRTTRRTFRLASWLATPTA